LEVVVLSTLPTRALAPALADAVAAVWRRRRVAVPLALAAAVTASASSTTLIHVHRGDTLSAIAARYHTTVARLVALNDLPGSGDLIYAGQSLRVPGSAAAHRSSAHYVVRRGDSLDTIAARFHVSPASVARANRLPSSLIVQLGQRLVIPGARTSSSSSGAAAPPDGGAGTAQARRDRARLVASRQPASSTIAAMIRATAARWGVDPRLALAISWQESGFDMHRVSGVDALGAMQVMPYTGAYLSADVVHRSLDLYDAQDNITAGVALLSVLVREAGSERTAVAGYYQGLASVRAHGMSADTKQYVRDVMALHARF
jgi:N-acetylmuramoyl-L-alanine amidase